MTEEKFGFLLTVNEAVALGFLVCHLRAGPDAKPLAKVLDAVQAVLDKNKAAQGAGWGHPIGQVITGAGGDA